MPIGCVSSGPADISPDLYKNVLKAEWGTNFKFNGLVHHNIDRVWIVNKIHLPKRDELFVKPLVIDKNCSFVWDIANSPIVRNPGSVTHIMYRDAMVKMCESMQPTLKFIQNKEKYLTNKIDEWFINELYRILPELLTMPNGHRHARALAALVSALITLTTVGVEFAGSHLSRKRDKATERAMHYMQDNYKLQENEIKQIKDSLIMCGKYNIDGLNEIWKTLGDMHNKTSFLESVMLGQNMDAAHKLFFMLHGPAVFSLNMNLYINQMTQEHNRMYEELLGMLDKLMVGLGKLSQGYLPAELIPPSRLQNITSFVLSRLHETHSEYTLALDKISHYYDMKLASFGVTSDHSLVITFPVFIKPYRNKPLNLYEIETVAVPIPDENQLADSYSQVEIKKPYIAVNQDFYIQLRIQELRMCKQIRFEYYCEELFLVKHKSVETCESSLFYTQKNSTILRNCNFEFSYNKSIIPSVLDGGSQIVLANMVNSKRLTCARTFNLGAPLPSYKYVTVSRTILCNCEIDASLSYVLRSIGSCSVNKETPKLMFTTNLAFQETFSELWRNTTPPPVFSEVEIQYPIFLNTSHTVHTGSVMPLEEPESLKALKEWYLHLSDDLPTKAEESDTFHFWHKDTHESNKAHKIFVVVIALVVTVLTVIAGSLLLKHYRTKTLITGMSLVALPSSAQALEEGIQSVVCTNTWMTVFTVVVTIVGLCIYAYKIVSNLDWLKGYRFQTCTKVYLILFNGNYFVPIKLLTVQAPAFTITMQGTVPKGRIHITKSMVMDTIEINWEDFKILKGNSQLLLPARVAVALKHKIKLRTITKGEKYDVLIMAKQGNNWVTIQPEGSDGVQQPISN
jgi:hypothetical protein